MRISRALAALAIAILACTAAQANDITGDELEKALQKNPNVLIEAIKANRKAIFDIINQTGIEEQARVQKEAERKAYENAFKNPLVSYIETMNTIIGSQSRCGRPKPPGSSETEIEHGSPHRSLNRARTVAWARRGRIRKAGPSRQGGSHDHCRPLYRH